MLVSDKRKFCVRLAYGIWVHHKEGRSEEIPVNWRSSGVCSAGCHQAFESSLLTAHLHRVSPLKDSTKPAGFCYPCANAVTVCDSLLCFIVSGFPEQHIPWLQHLADSSAALQGSEHWEGDHPSPFWLVMLPVGWLLPLWLNNTELLPLASLPFLFILHANSRISCPWLFYPDGKVICISYAQRNSQSFLHK